MANGSSEVVNGRISATLLKAIGLFLTIIGMVVCMAIWASNSHAEIKSWTADQDYDTKQEVKETMREQYVPLHQFTKVQQRLEDNKEDLKRIEKKLDRVLDRVSNRN